MSRPLTFNLLSLCSCIVCCVQYDELSQPRCVVPLHTLGISPMCLERCQHYNCSVVGRSIWNTAGFSLVAVIPVQLDKIMYYRPATGGHSCIAARQQLSVWNDAMVDILKLWRCRFTNPTQCSVLCSVSSWTVHLECQHVGSMISYHISYHIISYHIIIMSYIVYRICCFTCHSYHISYHKTSCHIISAASHVMSCHISSPWLHMPYGFTCHIISYTISCRRVVSTGLLTLCVMCICPTCDTNCHPVGCSNIYM